MVEAVQDYRTSCGARGWEGVANIQKLLAIGREVGVPIIYTMCRCSVLPLKTLVNRSVSRASMASRVV
jgi:hypothetical protein